MILRVYSRCQFLPSDLAGPPVLYKLFARRRFGSVENLFEVDVIAIDPVTADDCAYASVLCFRLEVPLDSACSGVAGACVSRWNLTPLILAWAAGSRSLSCDIFRLVPAESLIEAC